MASKNRHFGASDEGQDIVEYAIIVAVMAVAGIVAFSDFGAIIGQFWDKFTALLAG